MKEKMDSRSRLQKLKSKLAKNRRRANALTFQREFLIKQIFKEVNNRSNILHINKFNHFFYI